MHRTWVHLYIHIYITGWGGGMLYQQSGWSSAGSLCSSTVQELHYWCFYFTGSRWDHHLSPFLQSGLADWQWGGGGFLVPRRAWTMSICAQWSVTLFNSSDESIIPNHSTLFILHLFSTLRLDPVTLWLKTVCDLWRCHRWGDMLLMYLDISP